MREMVGERPIIRWVVGTARRYARWIGSWRIGVDDNIMKTRWVWKIVVLIVLAGVVWPRHVSAQDDPHEKNRIYTTGLSIINVGWTPDSLMLVYQIQNYDNVANRPINGPNTPNYDTWRQYYIITGQTIRASVWPLQPDLTEQQYQSFEIYNSDIDRSFVFQSPNGRYLVYTAFVSASSYGYPLGIADLSTGNHRILGDLEGIKRNNSLGDLESYMIRWSDGSSALTLHSIQRPGFYYISNLEDLTTLSIYSSESFPGFPLNDTTFYPGSVHDLSAAGDHLLVLGGTPNNTGRLVLWNMMTDSRTSIPIQGLVAGSVFAQNDQRVLFIDEEGLKQYDIPENQTTLLNPEISSTWATGGAYFSPNGQYVAIRVDAPEPESLYLFEVPEIGDIPDDDSE